MTRRRPRAGARSCSTPNGNGVRDEWVEPGEPADPTKDTRIRSGFYGVAYNPVDGSIWGSSLGMPGAVLRFDPTGDNPSETGLTEFYEVPFENPGAEVQDGYSPRGMDIDRNGVVWTPLASGHMASFDPQQVHRPAERAGRHRPALPRGVDAVRGAHAPDEGHRRLGQHRGQLLHVGRPVRHPGAGPRPYPSTPATRPRACSRCATASGSPCGCRIRWGSTPSGWTAASTTPTSGWKGKGVWATWSTRAPFHAETGAGTPSKVVHFQIRPDALAK